MGNRVEEGKRPFTIDELLIFTFAPVDEEQWVICEDGAYLLCKPSEDKLLRIDPKTKRKFKKDMSERTLKNILKTHISYEV